MLAQTHRKRTFQAIGGPVVVTSGSPVYASQRVTY